jgi:hypothetical protein
MTEHFIIEHRNGTAKRSLGVCSMRRQKAGFASAAMGVSGSNHLPDAECGEASGSKRSAEVSALAMSSISLSISL